MAGQENHHRNIKDYRHSATASDSPRACVSDWQNFNVVEHILSSIDPCLVGASPSSFLREEIEEALRDGIVVAVPAFKLKQALGLDFEGG